MVKLKLSIGATLENVTSLEPFSNDFEYFFESSLLGKRESSAKFNTSSAVKPYVAENGQLQPILEIECRGLEFVGFDPRGTWKCVGAESGTKFDDVDLNEPEWVDYDEKTQLPVGVSEFKSEWSRA
ncbi:hypothetical protein H1R20_g9909, partial [Candolleomyces eurysporus]